MCEKCNLVEGENSRKCTKCGELKEFDDFSKDKSKNYGVGSRCKECLRLEWRVKNPPKPLPRPKILVLTPLDTLCPILIEGMNSRVCTECGELKRFKEFHKNKNFKYGISCNCKSCEKVRKKRAGSRDYHRWDEQSAIQEASNWNTIKELEINGRGAYGWIRDNDRPDILDPIRQIPRWTSEKVRLEALKYSTRSQFHRKSNSAYAWASRNSVLDQVCSHMADARRGFSKAGFIEKCQQKSKLGETDGLAVLYMIVCWNDDELFYKIGITSMTVEERYSATRDMPYNYRIMWQIRDEPGKIWNWEKESHRKTKQSRYQPKLWNSKSLETFTT